MLSWNKKFPRKFHHAAKLYYVRILTSVEERIDGGFQQHTAPQDGLNLPEMPRPYPLQTHCNGTLKNC